MTKKFVKQLEERNQLLRAKVRILSQVLHRSEEENKQNVKDFDRLGEALYNADPVAYQRHFEKVNGR